MTGKSHGQRSLAGYSPWGLNESDMTGWLRFSFTGRQGRVVQGKDTRRVGKGDRNRSGEGETAGIK